MKIVIAVITEKSSNSRGKWWKKQSQWQVMEIVVAVKND